jgi:hypothetical protein
MGASFLRIIDDSVSHSVRSLLSLDAGYWMLDTGCWVLDAGCGCWILDTRCLVQVASIWYLVSSIDFPKKQLFTKLSFYANFPVSLFPCETLTRVPLQGDRFESFSFQIKGVRSVRKAPQTRTHPQKQKKAALATSLVFRLTKKLSSKPEFSLSALLP